MCRTVSTVRLAHPCRTRLWSAPVEWPPVFCAVTPPGQSFRPSAGVSAGKPHTTRALDGPFRPSHSQRKPFSPPREGTTEPAFQGTCGGVRRCKTAMRYRRAVQDGDTTGCKFRQVCSMARWTGRRAHRGGQSGVLLVPCVQRGNPTAERLHAPCRGRHEPQSPAQSFDVGAPPPAPTTLATWSGARCTCRVGPPSCVERTARAGVKGPDSPQRGRAEVGNEPQRRT